MLTIEIPHFCIQESRYVIEQVFDVFLGIEYEVVVGHNDAFSLKCGDHQLETSAIFFKNAQECWLKKESLPVQPLKKWDTTDSGLDIKLLDPVVPVIFGEPGCVIEPKNIKLNLDIFGSVFYMLTCYEEAVKLDRDQHDRFPAHASLAYQEGFLLRPLVNEYLEILWSSIKLLWINLERKKRTPQTFVSCDVDSPYTCWASNNASTLKKIAGDIFKRKSLLEAVKTIKLRVAHIFGDFNADPFYTFDWMMNVNDKVGRKIAFYFITNHTDKVMDGCYNLDENIIKRLIVNIKSRGHEVGLHASYNTYLSLEKTKEEIKLLRAFFKKNGINQNSIGVRQHYLRWKKNYTDRNLSDAGVIYDTTLGFAEHIGFRCGTCYEFLLYDLIDHKTLKIYERPLIIMECSLMGKQYMNLTNKDEILLAIQNLKSICHHYQGNFTLLWHNSSFQTEIDKQIYLKALS
ncbi:MAG: polysaccharide deacetylase family protein [Gammaproteobacteria bacterium]|nr:polysaccharide deacetylase family protein [Gammaproteobacteria bacterium]